MTANSNQLPTVFGIESENTTDSKYRFHRTSPRAPAVDEEDQVLWIEWRPRVVRWLGVTIMADSPLAAPEQTCREF
jgi:hypothetical protein